MQMVFGDAMLLCALVSSILLRILARCRPYVLTTGVVINIVLRRTMMSCKLSRPFSFAEGTR